MLHLIKVKFKGIKTEEPLSTVMFTGHNQDYNITLSNEKLSRLNHLLYKLQTIESFYIAFHQEMNNIPFIIIDNQIHNFSEDSIYNLNDIENKPVLKSGLYSFLFMITTLLVTVPLTMIFTQIPFLNNSFWEILLTWNIGLGGFSYYCFKRYLGHDTFIKSKLSSVIMLAKKNNLSYIECDF